MSNSSASAGNDAEGFAVTGVEQGTRIVFDHVSDRVRRVRVLRFNDVYGELADLQLVALGHFEERLLVDPLLRPPSSAGGRPRASRRARRSRRRCLRGSAPVRDRGRDPYARGSPAPRPPRRCRRGRTGPGSSGPCAAGRRSRRTGRSREQCPRSPLIAKPLQPRYHSATVSGSASATRARQPVAPVGVGHVRLLRVHMG